MRPHREPGFELDADDDARIRAAVDAWRSSPIPDGPPEHVVRATVDRLRREQRRVPGVRLARSMRVAAAIVLLVGAAATVALVWNNPRGVAFAEVVERVSRASTFTATVVDADQRHKVMARGNVIRNEMPDGRVFLYDQDSGRAIQLDPARKQAVTFVMSTQPADVQEQIRRLGADPNLKSIGQREIEGRRLLGFSGTVTLPATTETQHLEVWVDPDSRLPVQIAEVPANGPAKTVLTDIRFDLPLDDSLFILSPPAGYQVMDLGGLSRDELKPPPTTEEASALTLKPGTGIGEARFGMSREEVERALGRPEVVQANGLSLLYASKGFSVLIHPKGGLQAVTVFERESVLGNVHTFAGTTDKGVGIGASAEQVEAAYGVPDRRESGGAAWIYEKLGLTVVLSDGNVSSISLRQPTRTSE